MISPRSTITSFRTPETGVASLILSRGSNRQSKLRTWALAQFRVAIRTPAPRAAERMFQSVTLAKRLAIRTLTRGAGDDRTVAIFDVKPDTCHILRQLFITL